MTGSERPVVLFFHALNLQMAKEGQHVQAPDLCTYDDLIRVSKAVLIGRTPQQQSELVRRCLVKGCTHQGMGFYRCVESPCTIGQSHGEIVCTMMAGV